MQKCGWCDKSIGTTSKSLVYCFVKDMQISRDSGRNCIDYMRATGTGPHEGDELDDLQSQSIQD